MQPSDTIRNYIAFRYPNWLDYARHMARVHHFEGWEEDLLNDVIADLLGKPETKLAGMLEAKTRMVVNGAATTELDKFVLAMMKLNACSPVAPFRKNTLGNKIISRTGGHVEVQRSTQLNGFDAMDESYDPDTSAKIDRMHLRNIKLMTEGGYTREAIGLYKKHFIQNAPLDRIEEIAIIKIKNYLSNP